MALDSIRVNRRGNHFDYQTFRPSGRFDLLFPRRCDNSPQFGSIDDEILQTQELTAIAPKSSWMLPFYNIARKSHGKSV